MPLLSCYHTTIYAHLSYKPYAQLGILKTVSRIGITLDKEPLLQPDVRDEEIRNTWSLIGLAINSVGYEVRQLIMNKLFAMFSGAILETLKEYFRGLKDEFDVFLTSRLEVLESVIERIRGRFEQIRERLSLSTYSYGLHGRKPFWAADWVNSLPGGSVKLGYYHRGSKWENDFNYMELFSYLAPAMFLGLAWLRPHKSPRLVLPSGL